MGYFLLPEKMSKIQKEASRIILTSKRYFLFMKELHQKTFTSYKIHQKIRGLSCKILGKIGFKIASPIFLVEVCHVPHLCRPNFEAF